MVKEGYKQTEIGVIPEDWQPYRIGDVVSFSGGSQPPRSTFVFKPRTGYLRLIQIRDYKTDVYETYIPEELAKKKCTEQDVMIGRYGPPIFQILRGIEGAYNVAIIKTIPSEKIDREFLYQFIKNDELFKLMEMLSQRSSGQTGVELPALREYPVALPPLEEQRSLAQALSDVDALIATLGKAIAKKRHIKTATMQQLLTGKKRLPGFGGEWEVKQLKELAHIQRGASPRPIDNPIWFNNNSLVGWVRISDVTRSGMYLRETEQRLSPLGVQHSRPVARNSLIMSICATVGRPIITEIDVCIHDGFVVFDSLQAVQLFMYYVLEWIEPDWSKHGQTGSQMNLNTELINGTTVRIPPLPEQTAIATVLSDMDAAIAALETRLAKTQSIKQGMMQQLLTGKVRLKIEAGMDAGRKDD